ncbi:ATP-binding protein [Saccharothrix australiensis]|uniref:ATP-binding protein n=1 Tax=Saccharothrix australiensis TaxID=2072 RepID=UPI0011C3D3F3|nr:ATP-binding protein [Saccharothrix australiensis]
MTASPIRNEISGSVEGTAVQVGMVMGDLHLHLHAAHREARDEPDQLRWDHDPHFTGRGDILERLEKLLTPAADEGFTPVVLHGLGGTGKTSVAVELAVQLSERFRPVFVSGRTRASLIGDLIRLGGAQYDDVWNLGIAAAAGPVTPQLPFPADTLLIVDGVTDVETLRGVIPRSAPCRVLITSTVRQLDQGYAQVELTEWQPEESVRYLELVLPDASVEDRRLLGKALHHHPLALTQAAHHCRLMARSVDTFLKHLVSEPLVALDVGEASGHRDTTLRTIQLNIKMAVGRESLAGDLLAMLAHLGTDPVPVGLLAQRLPVTYVKGYGTTGTEPQNRSQWFFRRRGKRPASSEERSDTARDMVRALSDAGRRERAIASLVSLSLVRVGAERLSVHPLVALVARCLAEDPLPWLQVGYGLFVQHLNPADDQLGGSRESFLGPIASLTDIAMRHGYAGTVVLAACVHLARRLAFYGVRNDPNPSLGADPVTLAHYALSAAEANSVTAPELRGVAVEARTTLAQLAWWKGDVGSAYELCMTNMAMALDYQDFRLYLRFLRSVGEIAAVSGDRKIAQDVLEKIVSEVDPRVTEPALQAGIAYTKTQILRLFNRIDEARTLNATVLEMLQEHSLDRYTVEMAHQMAAQLARDTDDAAAALHHELALLELRRASANDDRPDRHLVDSLHGAADAAIDVNNLILSAKLIDEAYTLAKDGFGQDSDVYATVLGVRGRLRLHQRHYQAAVEDLTAGNRFFQANPGMARGGRTAILIHLALATAALGDRKQALIFANEAYTLDRQMYGEDHPETLKDKETIHYLSKGMR